jgi:cytidylate kinase
MTVITLSRQIGCHGEEVALAVAQSLGLRLVDAKTIFQAAHEAGVPDVALAEMEHQEERGLANEILKALRAMPGLSGVPMEAEPRTTESEALQPERHALQFPFVGLFTAVAPPLSVAFDRYVRMVGMVIRKLAREGNVLLLGRGSQVLLRSNPGVLHVQVVAPLDYRLGQVMAGLRLSKREAQNRVRASDHARSDYLRRYHDVDWLDPTLYDLVINTGRLTVEAAAQLIVDAQRALQPPAAQPGPESQEPAGEALQGS